MGIEPRERGTAGSQKPPYCIVGSSWGPGPEFLSRSPVNLIGGAQATGGDTSGTCLPMPGKRCWWDRPSWESCGRRPAPLRSPEALKVRATPALYSGRQGSGARRASESCVQADPSS